MVAINTDYKNDIPSIEAIEEQLARISEAGFSYVQWVHDWQGEYIYSDIEFIQIKKLLDKYDLKVKGIHASEGGVRARKVDGKLAFINRYRNKENRKDYTSTDEYTRLAGVELIKNRVDLAYVIGAKEIILHMQLPYMELKESEKSREEYWEQVFKSLDELENYCKAMGVRIALENMICTPIEYQIKQFDKLFNRYDHDFLGFCFDSGHSALMSPDDRLIFAKRYLDRIIALHLHDNDGIDADALDNDVEVLKGDKHKIPFEGVIEWEKLAKIIAKSPYELPITLELTIVEESIEKEMERLRKAKASGERLNKLVKGYRDSI